MSSPILSTSIVSLELGGSAVFAVEEPELHAAFIRDAGELLLCPAEKPIGREISVVLVRVGVTHHDFLDAAPKDFLSAEGMRAEQIIVRGNLGGML